MFEISPKKDFPRHAAWQGAAADAEKRGLLALVVRPRLSWVDMPRLNPTGDELVERAHARGVRALALTDRDGVHGVVRAHVKARELGLSLIIGSEVTIGTEDTTAGEDVAAAATTARGLPAGAPPPRRPRPPPPACCSR